MFKTNLSIFVYGTLKRGEPNNGVMNDETKGSCSFIGNGRTVNKFPLIIATDYNIPFCLNKPNIGHVSFFFKPNNFIF